MGADSGARRLNEPVATSAPTEFKHQDRGPRAHIHTLTRPGRPLDAVPLGRLALVGQEVHALALLAQEVVEVVHLLQHPLQPLVQLRLQLPVGSQVLQQLPAGRKGQGGEGTAESSGVGRLVLR
jgi:hypothetical protein